MTDYYGHADLDGHPPVHSGPRTRLVWQATREAFGLENDEPWVIGLRYIWTWADHLDCWVFALQIFDHLTGEIAHEVLMNEVMAREHVNGASDLFYRGAVAAPGAPIPPPPPRPRWEPPTRPRQEPPRP